MKGTRILVMALVLGLLVAGCSQQTDPLAPQDNTRTVMTNKDGTEFLGEIAIAAGSGFAEGGVGMVDTDSGTLDITVPAGATVEQVLLYWMGGTTEADGDDTIEVDGNPVTGDLIGGPTNFFANYDFRAYRADVTAEGWVVPGANSFTITGFNFDFSGGTLDENNGAGMIVIYDDGTAAELQLFDGLDMAFFKFSSTLDATAPVTFDFAAEGSDRTAQFVVLAGSVGRDRPNMITVTTSAGDQVFDNPLGSMDGLLFDSITLDVLVPAGDIQLTAQLFSVVSEDPLGASLGWVGTGLSVPVTPPVQGGCTLTIGFWKKHAGLGRGNQDDVLSQYLPLWLGDDGGSKSYLVTDAGMAVDFLSQKVYGKPNNGITKLYAQMLAAKLNVAAMASDGDIAMYLADADAFLADYNYMDWDSLSDEMVDDVMMWHDAFDDYNNGRIGPGHCDEIGAIELK